MIVAIHNYSWMVGKGVRVSGKMREYFTDRINKVS